MEASLGAITALIGDLMGLVNTFPVNIIAAAFVGGLAITLISRLIGVFRQKKEG